LILVKSLLIHLKNTALQTSGCCVSKQTFHFQTLAYVRRDWLSYGTCSLCTYVGTGCPTVRRSLDKFSTCHYVDDTCVGRVCDQSATVYVYTRSSVRLRNGGCASARGQSTLRQFCRRWTILCSIPLRNQTALQFRLDYVNRINASVHAFACFSSSRRSLRRFRSLYGSRGHVSWAHNL
jgi:hypothetical protein